MKTTVTIGAWALLFTLVFMVGPQSHALGDDKGNGGGGYYLPATKGESEKVLNVDLWEGQKILKYQGKRLNIKESDEPVQIQIDRALSRLHRYLIDREFSGVLSKAEKIVNEAEINFLDPDVQIKFPSDVNSNFYPKGSEPVGVMLFHDGSETMDVRQDLVQLMSRTHQAAANVHEKVYKALRMYWNEVDSTRARELTAFAFSDLDWPQYDDFVGRFYECRHLKKEKVYAKAFLYPIENGTRINFQVYNFQKVAAKTYVDLPQTDFDQIGKINFSSNEEWVKPPLDFGGKFFPLVMRAKIFTEGAKIKLQLTNVFIEMTCEFYP